VEAKSALANAGVAEEEVAIKVQPVVPEKATKPETEAKGRDFFVTTFEIELTKPPGESLGLELDPLDGEVMQVCKIRDGLVKSYNEANKDKQVRVGDFLTSINGVTGRTDLMIERFQKDATLKVKIRRLKSWDVTLVQPRAAAIRPAVNRAANGRTLLILDISDRAIKEWNAANPGLDIAKHDRIISVNGMESESDKMMEQVEKAEKLVMTLGRPSPERKDP
jgi:hypothetical protein